jgi:5-methylcytosine-specific restriction endonuclease McrA
MKNGFTHHAALSDPELLIEVRQLVSTERQATARLIAALAELDARRLYLGEGCSSLFTYCTQVLHLSEHAAYGRIEAARAARKWPIVLDLLADGSLHLTAVSLLRPHLTDENHRELLAAARHKTKRQVEEIIAALRPQPAVPSTVRKLPERTPPVTKPSLSETSRLLTGVLTATEPEADRVEPRPAPSKRIEIKPLAPERYKVQFTISRETNERLREAQNLLRHCIPDGDVALIFDRALSLLVAELRRTKHAAVKRPGKGRLDAKDSRYIPAAIKRAVWARDGGQCAFVGVHGRCSERAFLEYHHVVPFADGGLTTVENIQLRCRAHNAYEAERWFGVGEEELVREAGLAFG